jgi:choline dehydrogenase-like flavoprotein
MATNVLLSNTSYAYALYLNIVQFSRAIMGDDRIVNFEKKYKEMEKRIEELEKSIKVLSEENRALKEWAGESAPIEHDQAAAARTGTDESAT